MLPRTALPRAARFWPALVLVMVVAAGAILPGGTRPSVAAPTAASPDPSVPFGIAGAMRWPDWGSYSVPVDAVMQTGASWVREDFAWGLIEPQRGRFEWTATDRIVGALNTRGMNILGIISYSTSWATPAKEDDGAALSLYPPDLNLYADFVRTLVGRYKSQIHYWEVWNEPNNGDLWKPAPNARQYAELLKTAYRAIKEADPTAKVLTGGMSGNAVPFLEEMEAAGAGSSYDILAIHAYATPLDPNNRAHSNPEVFRTRDIELPKYRAFLQRHGHDRPIWITEIGWPAANWTLDEQMQADYLAQSFALALSSGMVDRIFWYSWKDADANGKDSWGLVKWGGGTKDLGARRPSFAAFATAVRMLTGTKGADRLPLGPVSAVSDFEQPWAWARSTNPQGSLTQSTEQKHSGNASGKLEYNFTGPSQAVDFAPPRPVDMPGNPARLGVWVMGDGSGNYLSAWLRDRDGELLKVRLASVTGARDGWHYYEARIQDYYYDWEHAGGSPGNGKVDYPVQFVSFRLENTPDEPAGAGAIYIDDLVQYNGPDATGVRFARGGGEVVDVVWAPANGTKVEIPTASGSVEVTGRDGGAQTVPASGGKVALQVGTSPVYVVHKPAGGSPTTGIAGATNGQIKLDDQGAVSRGLCDAAKPAQQAGGALLYFPETGHNLGGAFRRHWEANGGITQFGFPITEEFIGAAPDGKKYVQQYFERARFEFHPENPAPNDVQLGLLGVWVTSGRTFDKLAASPGSWARFFPETGQALGLFKWWWESRGGLTTYGFPISPELEERNPTDGKTYAVQYFERNRLEYHPEAKGTPNEVMLGLLGTEYLSKQGCK